MTKTATVRGVPWKLEHGGCAALPLPADRSIAAVARAEINGLLPALGLAVQDVHDLTVMVSELATNVLLHATSDAGPPGGELWVYQRSGERGHDELVVKAFDTLRQWRDRRDPPGEVAEHGRGLRLIEILAKGRWGHHPSRSRLSSPIVRGKATWFAVPVTRTSQTDRGTGHGGEPHAMRNLHQLLVRRGVERLKVKEELGVTMLSGPGDLTVWCETATFRWCSRSGETGKLPLSDITEVCEQLVRLHEAMDVHG